MLALDLLVAELRLNQPLVTEEEREVAVLGRRLAASLDRWPDFEALSQTLRIGMDKAKVAGEEVELLLGLHRRNEAEHRLESVDSAIPRLVLDGDVAALESAAKQMLFSCALYARYAGHTETALALLERSIAQGADPCRAAILAAAIHVDRGDIAEAEATLEHLPDDLSDETALASTRVRLSARVLEGDVWASSENESFDVDNALQVAARYRLFGAIEAAETLLSNVASVMEPGPNKARLVALPSTPGTKPSEGMLVRTSFGHRTAISISSHRAVEEPEVLPVFAALAAFSTQLDAALNGKTSEQQLAKAFPLLRRLTGCLNGCDSPRIIAQIEALKAHVSAGVGRPSDAAEHYQRAWIAARSTSDRLLKANIACNLMRFSNFPYRWAHRAESAISHSAQAAPNGLERRAFMRIWGRVLSMASITLATAAHTGTPRALQRFHLRAARLDRQDPLALSVSLPADVACLTLAIDGTAGLAALEFRGNVRTQNLCSVAAEISDLCHEIILNIERRASLEETSADDRELNSLFAQVSRCLAVEVLTRLDPETPLFIRTLGAPSLLPLAALRLPGTVLGLRHPMARFQDGHKTEGRPPQSRSTAFVFSEPVPIKTTRYPELPAARAEAATLAQFGLHCVVERSAAARKAKLIESLARAGSIHISGHGSFEPFAPDRSALFIPDADGGPAARLTIADVMALPRVLADEIALFTCSGGEHGLLTDGRSLSFADSLVDAGARTVVAFRSPLHDNVAAKIAIAYHRNRVKHSAPHAIYRVRRAMAEEQLPIPLLSAFDLVTRDPDIFGAPAWTGGNLADGD